MINNKNKIKLSILSSVLIGLSFQPLNLGFLAWFALVPFIIILFNSSSFEGMVFGFLIGLISNLISLYWLSENIGTTFVIGLISLISTAIYLSIFWSIFSLIFCFINNNSSKGIYFFPFGWVIFEYCFSIGIMGFPWMSLATTQTNYLPVIQIAEFTGIFGISFWIACLNIIIFKIFSSNFEFKIKNFNNFIFLLVAVWLFGYVRIFSLKDEYSNSLEILVVQPNLNPNEKWNKKIKEKIFDDLIELSKVNINYSTDLIIWPEVATPFYIFKNHSKLTQIRQKLLKHNSYLLTGSLDWSNEENKINNYNSVGLIGKSQKISTYDKIKLVPFGEFTPFSIPFLNNLNLGKYTPGTKNTIFNINNFNFITKICFESIYPLIFSKSEDKKININFLVIIVNDGWFGNSAGPYQHFGISKLRAIENRIPVIRSANTGVSAIINKKGEVENKIGINQKGVILSNILPANSNTFYSKHGNWLVNLSLFCFIYFSFLAIKRKIK